MAAPECSSCPLTGRAKKIYVPSTFGPGRGGLAIVGESPWTEEARDGRPFVGRSGKLLDAVLHAHGVRRADCHVLNAFSCYAGEVSDADKKAAARACLPRLETELQQVQAEVVLALGGTALGSLLGDWTAKVTQYLGATVPWGSAQGAIPSYHPAAILRGTTGCELAVLAAHVEKAARWLAGGKQGWKDSYSICRSADELRAFAATWPGEVAIDVETTAKNRFLCDLRTIGIGTAEHALVIPCLPGERDEAGWPALVAELQRIMTSPFLRKIFHNKQYDIAVLERHVGSPVAEPTEDTMVAHFVLHPLGNVLHGLAPAAGMYLDVPAWKKEHEGDFADEPLEELALYNSRDVRITHALHGELKIRIVEAHLEDAYVLQNDNPRLALDLSRVGVPVDLTAYSITRGTWAEKASRYYLEALDASGIAATQTELYNRMVGAGARRLQGMRLADWDSGAFDRSQVLALQDAVTYGAAVVLDRDAQKRLTERAEALAGVLEAWGQWTAPRDVNGERKGPHAGKLCQQVRSAASALVAAAGQIPFLNLDSDREVGIILHERLGLPVAAPPNADGTYATNEEALWHLKKHPFVAAWQAWKEAKKQQVWLEDLPVYPDGRLHPVYGTTRIPTTRFNSGGGAKADPLERFNALNIEPRHLLLFHPAPGYVLVGADFSAVELRTSAVLSGCTTMIEQFHRADRGEDLKLHAQTARLIWPNEPAERWSTGKLYDMAKRANFLTIYGGGPDTLFARLRELEKPLDDPAAQAAADAELHAQCEAVLRTHKQVYPEIHETARKWYYDAMRTGVLPVCHITGHRYIYPVRDRQYIKPTLCANAPVQCTASTVEHLCAHQLRRVLPRGANIILYVYDALYVECRVEQAQEVAARMRETLRYWLEGPAGGLWLYAEPTIGWTLKEVK